MGNDYFIVIFDRGSKPLCREAMLKKMLKVSGIVLAVLILIAAAGGLWVYFNQGKIFRKVQEAVNQRLDGELSVESYHFSPLYDGLGFTFKLSGIRLHDRRFATYKTELLRAERLLVTLDVRRLFSRKVVIRRIRMDNGEVFIFKTRDGFSNLSVFGKSKSDSTVREGSAPAADFLRAIRQITLANCKVTVADSSTMKRVQAVVPLLVNRLSSTDSSVNNDVEGHVLFREMVFKASQGSFLRNKNTKLDLHLSYNSASGLLHIRPSSLQTADHEVVGIGGQLGFADGNRKMHLVFDCKNMPVPAALSLLTRHLQERLGRFGKKARATARVDIYHTFESKATRVEARFKADSLSYQIRLGLLHGISAGGFFTNQADPVRPPGDDNSLVRVSNIRGYFETLPLSGNLLVSQLKNAHAVLDCRVTGDRKALNGILDDKRYRVSEGKMTVAVDYQGPLKEMYNEKTNRLNGQLKGKIVLDNLALVYVPRQIQISQIRGNLSFDERVVTMPEVYFFDGENKVYLSGSVDGLLPHFYEESVPLRASIKARIPDWKVNWITAFVNNSPSRQGVTRKRHVQLADLLDDAIDNIRIDARLDAGTLRYKSLVAQNVVGQMSLSRGSLALDNFSMNACGGSVRISGGINFENPRYAPQVYLRGKLSNADVKSVFASLENFGQETVTHQNIRGKLTSDFYFNSQLTNQVALVPSSMNGKIRVRLNQAELINFGPFLRIKRLLFKNRNLEHVRFDLMEREFILRGEEIEFSKMQIESNAFTLFVDGTYSFGAKTDIGIQVPLSNFRKRDENYQFREYHPDSVGRSIYLKAVDDGGKVVIRPVIAPGKRKRSQRDTDREPEFDDSDEGIIKQVPVQKNDQSRHRP